MSPIDPSPKALDEQRLEEAALRLLHSADVQGGDSGERSGQEDAERHRADLAVARAWSAVGEVGSTPEMIALRRAALNNAGRAAKSRWSPPLRPGRLWMGAAAALVVVGGASFAIYLWSAPLRPQVYETPVGERRVITLSDNSKIALDEDSQVSVKYSSRLRDLELIKGQAEFDVAHDRLRPFSVSAAGRRVVATGTLFDVDLLDKRLFVTLLRGRVVVARDHAEAAGDAIPLKPSERLVVERATGATTKTTVDAADIEAWKLGKLVFEVEPLDEAVVRVNRYARRKIALDSPNLGRQPISGVFNVGDVDAFADAVGAQLNVRAEERGNTVALVPR